MSNSSDKDKADRGNDTAPDAPYEVGNKKPPRAVQARAHSMQKSVAAMFFSLPRHALSAHLQVGRSPADRPVSDGLRSLVTERNTGRGDKTGRQENRGFSKAFQPDSLLDLAGSRTEENREALSDYRERLLKRRPFRGSAALRSK